MTGEERPLLIEPFVSWPEEAELGRAYLVTVDLEGPRDLGLDGDHDDGKWPYPEEEFSFSVALDGAPCFSCEAIDDPSLVLHRFGGTYGKARFVVTALHEADDAPLWLTISNQRGVPVRTEELPCRVTAGPVPARTGTQSPPTGEYVAAPPDRPGEAHPSDDGPPPQGTDSRGRRTDDDTGTAPRMPVEGVVVIHAPGDRAWSMWLGDRLRRRGHQVVHQRWDHSDTPLTESLADLQLAPGRVLFILGEGMLHLGPWTPEEWTTALNEAAGHRDARLTAAFVQSGVPPGLSRHVPVIALDDTGEAEAEERLLAHFGLPADPAPYDMPQPPLRFPNDPHVVWRGVPDRNPRFTGRTALLADAYRTLAEAQQRPGTAVLTLCGEPGAGKTQLATEYAYRFGAEYDAVWWVTADHSAACRRDLSELAPALGLATGDGTAERWRAVQEALRTGRPYRRWLVILDSADKPADIAELVPPGPGHVLITSRDPHWAEHNALLMRVRKYKRRESIAFIGVRAPRLTRDEANQLAEALEDLPLLLDQTAGWLGASDMTVDSYLHLLAQGSGDDGVAVSESFPQSFRRAWSVLLDKIAESVPEAVDLLRMCTYFAPGAFPVRRFKAMAPEGLPPGVARLVSEPERWDATIGALTRNSLVGLDRHEYLSIHRLLHTFVHQRMPRGEHDRYMRGAWRMLVTADPKQPMETFNWPVYAEITPNLRVSGILGSTDADAQQLVFNCLRFLHYSGEYAEGIVLAEKAYTKWRANLGDAHPQLWELSRYLTDLTRAVGDYARSEALDREAVAYSLRAHGPRTQEHLVALGSLAADLRGLGRYDESLRLCRDLHEEHRALAGEDERRTLNARNNLAVSLRLVGQYTAAYQLDLRTLEVRRQKLGRSDPAAMFSEIHHAENLRLLGRYREAVRVQETSLAAHRSAMGEDTPQTLVAGHMLALCRYLAGDRTGGRPLLEQVLRKCERVLGEDDPTTLMVAASAAWVERDVGSADVALRRHHDLLGRYSRMLGLDHPCVLGVQGNRGLTQLVLGEVRQGTDDIEHAHGGMRAAVGPDHPWSLACALNAASARAAVGFPGSALDLGRDTENRSARTLGPHHPLTLACRVGRVADLRTLGRDREAADEERAVLADLSGVLGPDHPVTVEARNRVRPRWDFEPPII